MKKYLTLIICLFILQIGAQTKFKHRVYVRVPKYVIDESKKNVKHSYFKYSVKKLSVAKIKEKLKIAPNASLTETEEVEIKGVKYKVERKSVEPTVREIEYDKEKLTSELVYSKYVFNKAILHVSKDTIYFNFWANRNYYSSLRVKGKSSFNTDEKYFITLQNRESVWFTYANLEMSTLTLPFKYQFKVKKEGNEIQPDITTGINLNLFLGTRVGRVRYFYDKYKGMTEGGWSYTIGFLAGINALKIDSASTSYNTKPVIKEMTVPSLSYGGGIIFNVDEFSIGLFLGQDAGLSKDARKWNYNNKPWLGFGFGYKLGFIGKSN